MSDPDVEKIVRTRIEALLLNSPLVDADTLIAVRGAAPQKTLQRIDRVGARLQDVALLLSHEHGQWEQVRALIHAGVGIAWMLGFFAFSEYASKLDDELEQSNQSPQEPYWWETLSTLYDMSARHLKAQLELVEN